MTAPQRIEPLLIPVDEAGRALGIGRSKAWELLALGYLERRQIGGRTLVTVESVRKLAAEDAPLAKAPRRHAAAKAAKTAAAE